MEPVWGNASLEAFVVNLNNWCQWVIDGFDEHLETICVVWLNNCLGVFEWHEKFVWKFWWILPSST